jgi:hypothetical protein
MDEEDDIFENQTEFLAERDVWNRIGGEDIGLGLGSTINLKKSGYTINEKFKLITLATINLINDLDFVSTNDRSQYGGKIKYIFQNDEIQHVLSLVEKIPDFEYKNPSAFVMGYWVALYSNYATIEINKNVLHDMFQINQEITDDLFAKIEDVDIIRYTRMCLLNKLK